ncbi:hypothetical protein HYPSUDRAFT_38431 [Hypholoma sublateritium FD-334 SS-4]|uniref:Uncharacterized protein n=1 Tax=Hypholoma sublateritium (strain FD-334 SS-4) TaxID=945553 RepID=A0A0D2P1J6_HYPSF|nr:hypothetical protein HYPSUDRAFT_38431 [Hypholoma sublateritium FD-334 SS-4]
MEVYTPPAPIYGVNDDVLMCIFMLNGNMFFDSQALHTTRATSQVCRQWRNLTLEAPLLWAKLIDMDICYRDRRLDWINEIFRRSGVAPLWIKAVNGRHIRRTDTDNIEKFIYDIVSKNWDRIQKLVVIDDSTLESRCNLIFPMLRFPAPQLENFTMLRTNHYSDRKIPPIKSLFSTHAPMIRTFRLAYVSVDHQDPWIRQLHTMLLDSAYSIGIALTVLLVTNNLQELEITDITYGDIATSLPIAALPHLKYLKLCGEPTQHYATLLDHMKIPVSCSVIIRMSYRHDHSRNAERRLQIERVFDVFIRRAEGYLKSHKFDAFHLDYKPRDYLTLKLIGKLPVECMLSISIPLYQDLVSMSLDRMYRRNLSSATTFQLRTSGSLSPPSFRSFFERLTSVHTIRVDQISLRYLTSLQSSINAMKKPIIILPHLKVIHVFISDDTHVFTVDEEFFLSRLKKGRPIKMLDISKGLPLTSPPNLNALKLIKGLKVRYKLAQTRGIFEHTCGSGKPANRVEIL